MGYLLENKLYWKYENITQLAKKNVSDARKIVEKNKEGIEELLHQGVNLDKIKNLSETDKELMAALYILVYREEKDKRINNKTNKEFIESIFDNKFENVIEDIETFKDNVKKVIMDPKRYKVWKGSDDEEEKKQPYTSSNKKEDEEPEPDKNNNTKSKEEDKNSDEDEDDEIKPKEKTTSKSFNKSDSEDRKFAEAIEELEDKKNDAIEELKKLIDGSKNPKPIASQIEQIETNYLLRINNIKKAQSGLVLNPKLKLQQELAAGKNFINRSVLLAKKTQMPNTLQRAGMAVRDIGKAIGRESTNAWEAIKKTYPARIIKQLNTDARARKIFEILGKEKMEKYVFSNNTAEKQNIYNEAMKKRTVQKASPKQEETPKNKEDKEKEEKEREAREREYTKTYAQKERERKEREKRENIVSSTNVSSSSSINEQLKQRIKNNIKDPK